MTNPATDAAQAQLIQLGDPAGASCDGEFCEIPAHHEQAIVNTRVDEGLI